MNYWTIFRNIWSNISIFNITSELLNNFPQYSIKRLLKQYQPCKCYLISLFFPKKIFFSGTEFKSKTNKQPHSDIFHVIVICLLRFPWRLDTYLAWHYMGLCVIQPKPPLEYLAELQILQWFIVIWKYLRAANQCNVSKSNHYHIYVLEQWNY